MNQHYNATLVKTTSSKLQHTGQIQLNMKNHNYSSSIASLHCSEEKVATSGRFLNITTNVVNCIKPFNFSVTLTAV